VPRYHAGRVVLVGDAAHALTPDLGQGDCQALEDADTLTHLLAGNAEVPAALAGYGHARRRRTERIARSSALWGTIAEWCNPVAGAMRDTIVRLLPPWVFLRASQQTLG
jgi:2-polyprenyl-6-methoxyphenol hydroxylase-like FAD-dependent oxidoreductase